MRSELLRYLNCPSCTGDLGLDPSGESEVTDGELVCASCARRFPITGGIPRLLVGHLADSQERTARAFGWEWKHFAELHPEYERQFLDWIYPLGRDFFVRKRVLDAGCGTGRHAFLAARFGAAEVVALDFSEAVETAYANVHGLPNVHVLQGDLHEPPLRTAEGAGLFDFVYSIGVLHHLPDPRAGFLSLTRFVRPGGTLFVWVYGYEGNAFVRHVVEPFRRLTTRISPSLLRYVSWPLSVVLYAVVKCVYRPLKRTPAFRILPLRDYLGSLGDFSFRQIDSIVFDQLVAPSSRYIKRAELEEWFTAAELEGVEISWRNRNSWRGRGQKPERRGPERSDSPSNAS